MQFLRLRAQLGASDTRTDSHSVAVVGQRVPRGGSPWPELPDPSAMERREQKQTNNTTDHRTSITLPSPVPHPHHPHHLPCQPPPQPSFRCLTTHTRSWGWVVKHRPHPAISPVAGPNPAFKPKIGCGTGTQAHENLTPTRPANTTASRHRQRTRSRPSHTRLQPMQHLSAVKYGKARGGRGDRPEGPPFGCQADLVSQKNEPAKTIRRRPTCSLRTKPRLPVQPFFSRLKIVLGSLGTDPGAGALPGFDGEDGGW